MADTESFALKCPVCGHGEAVLVWQRFVDGRRHIRANCGACGRFNRYVPLTRENQALAIEEAPQVPVDPQQLPLFSGGGQ